MWEFSVAKSDRLDRALRECDGKGSEWLSRQAWDWLLEHGHVFVDGRRALKAGQQVNAGSALKVTFPAEPGLFPGVERATPVWQAADRSLAAFAKPVGVDSVALLPWDRSSFASQVAAFAENEGWMPAPQFAALAEPPHLEGGLLQRLDRDTSGLLLAAFTPERKAMFRQLFSESKIAKEYLAIVTGIANGLSGAHRIWLEAGGGPKVKASLKAPKGRAEEISLTVEVCKSSAKGALVKVSTKQGARHVVRAGMAALGAPLFGDVLYGGNPGFGHHELHASALLISAPGVPERIEAPAPKSFLDSLAHLGLD